ncbi:hypothetical protein BK645_10095 [Pseudomonas protegens]|uniref:hypothetical protein n=1 Tax=Pseudomonas protegens TaxID=380021 RepID=UPI000381E8CD|nr:hypothetical protein [Pseudomonas protegens]ROM29311.1 hypothetical protein BK645_10095 [Pseudomonas protegens]ROM36944.1 hypothetical protein BK646_18140 [Pseudomonas protegens]
MSMCDCNQGRLPCTCKPIEAEKIMIEAHRYKVVTMLSQAGATIGYDPHGPDVVMADALDRVIAERDALQERLNAADQKDDDLSFQLKDREGSRRDWFEVAQVAEKRVAVLEQALRFYSDGEHYHFESGNWDTVSGEPLNILWCGDEPDFIEDGTVARNALSACAEPSAPVDPVDAALDRISVKLDRAIELCEASIEKAPTERDERAEFEAHRKSMGLCVKRMPGRPDLYEDNYTQGGWTSWQARAALDKATEGASHE